MTASPIPPPNYRELLPPLLACIATANTSKQPPPALLPLLSPILRQRVALRTSDNWLKLLCWDDQVALKLPEIASNINVEPHPASGEIEVEDPDRILYRRADPETLHARVILGEFGLIVQYLWCTGGESGDAWKLAELRGLEHEDDGTQWFATISEADEGGFRRISTKPNGTAAQTSNAVSPTAPQPAPAQEEDDDDAYWAAYDRTPGRTPARTPQVRRSPAPFTPAGAQMGLNQNELEYFARYATEVQPALDAHDPDEEGPAPTETTLNGNALNLERKDVTETSDLRKPVDDISSFPPYEQHYTNGNGVGSAGAAATEATNGSLGHPRPTSPASSGSGSIANLERQAESSSQAERAIKQHISTDIKSLFRMAKSAGIAREEFEEIIKRELEVLPLLEQEE